MALCDKCEFYDKAYDEMRQMYDDCIKIGGDKRERHYCIMYDDYIPLDITYKNADCSQFLERGEE